MKSTWKRIISLCLVFALMFTMTACGLAAKGQVTEDAVARKQSDGTDGEVFIDDEAIALAGAALEGDQVYLDAAKKALDLTNEERAKEGLASLVWSDDLAMAAYVRAQESVVRWSHTRPNNTDWWTVNSDIMYGENLAKGYSTAEDAVKAWMKSKSHKANIMASDFITLGIAIFKADNGKWHWAQEFGY